MCSEFIDKLEVTLLVYNMTYNVNINSSFSNSSSSGQSAHLANIKHWVQTQPTRARTHTHTELIYHHLHYDGFSRPNLIEYIKAIEFLQHST